MRTAIHSFVRRPWPWAPPCSRGRPRPEERKVLKLALTKAETGLDPARIVDLYSRNLTAHSSSRLYRYDPLARPAKIKPLTADGMPEASADFRVWTGQGQAGHLFRQ